MILCPEASSEEVDVETSIYRHIRVVDEKKRGRGGFHRKCVASAALVSFCVVTIECIGGLANMQCPKARCTSNIDQSFREVLQVKDSRPFVLACVDLFASRTANCNSLGRKYLIA